MSARRLHRLRPPRSLRATRAGWCFVVIVFGVGFAALNTGNNLLYLVLSLLLGFLVLSGLLSESSLRGLRVERHLPAELFAGRSHRVGLRLCNDRGRTPSFAVWLEDRVDGAEGPETAGRSFALRVGPGARVDRSYLFEPPRRGDLRFVSCRLATRFPFGLFVKSVELDLEQSALVYPELYDAPARAAASQTRSIGEPRRRATSDGDALNGVREYREGEAIQRIHWRRSLRARRLIVGERDSDSRGQIEILLRLPQDLEPQEVEARVSRAASEVVAHLDAGADVGLRTARTRFAPAAGVAHRAELLACLARVEVDPNATLDPPAPEAQQPRRAEVAG